MGYVMSLTQRAFASLRRRAVAASVLLFPTHRTDFLFDTVRHVRPWSVSHLRLVDHDTVRSLANNIHPVTGEP
jgi:hypothetical protein